MQERPDGNRLQTTPQKGTNRHNAQQGKAAYLLQSAVHIADAAHVFEANKAGLALVLGYLVRLLPERCRPCPKLDLSIVPVPVLRRRMQRHSPSDASRRSKPWGNTDKC